MAGVVVAARTLVVAGADGSRAVVVEAGPDGTAIVDGTPEPVTLTVTGLPRARLDAPGPGDTTMHHQVLLLASAQPEGATIGLHRVEVVVDGWHFEVDVEPEARARLRERATKARGELAKGGSVELRAIIPGRVITVDVADGDTVEAGQRVLVVEAMKMQNELRSPRAGRITRVAIGAGQNVELGDVMIVIE